MKKRTSMTYITAVFRKVWRCGYCDLQNILYGIDPEYYNSGVYGWNCDIYITEAGAFTTGYRNMRGERIPYDLIEKYDTEAREIIKGMWTDNEYRNKLNDLRARFYNELEQL